jgi:flagellar hook-associated protein 3 FlgL
MVNRVATFPATDRLINGNTRLQVKLAEQQEQISTGLKSYNYIGIARDTQRLLSLENSQDNLRSYSMNGKMVMANVDIMFNAVDEMVNLSNKFVQTLTAGLGGNFLQPQVMQDQADLLMREMAGLLNIQSAGRYLFAGSAIDVVPVDLADPAWIAQTPPSVVNSSYYQGDNTILDVRVSETMVVDYGFTANNPAFEMALRSYNLVFNNSTNPVAIAEALDLMKAAILEMSNVQAAMSTNSRTIEDQIVRNEEDALTLTELISNIKEVDLAETSVKLQQTQTQLEASYATTTRLMNLNLFDFL